MILIDAVFINNSGAKILLDYLINELERQKLEVMYLLDDRVKNKHPLIHNNLVVYVPGSLIKRHLFYKRYRTKFDTILCLGNLPPTLPIRATVYTYFHQTLYINTPKEFSFSERVKFWLKTLVLNFIKSNSNVWLVQSEKIKSSLTNKYKIESFSVKVLPFYPKVCSDKKVERVKNRFIYVSGSSPHKNQIRLVNSFIKFFNSYKQGELHLTIGSEGQELCSRLKTLRIQGYPIFNHGFISQKELGVLYRSSEYCIYPSLTESFGLGIIEAMENGCKIIGADRPYMYAVCEPSLCFDPESEDAIFNAFKIAVFENLPMGKQLIFDQIDDLLDLLVYSN